MDMNGFFLINRLIFLAVLAFLVLIGLIWKKFKPDSWVLEEFDDPYIVEYAPDLPVDPAFLSWVRGWRRKREKKDGEVEDE